MSVPRTAVCSPDAVPEKDGAPVAEAACRRRGPSLDKTAQTQRQITEAALAIFLEQGITRATDKAGGTEGGMSTGTPLRVRAGMKPIATIPRALRTVDVATGETAAAHHQRSDVCAVPAAGVVAEAMVAIVLADVVLEKFGGDSIGETRRNLEAYLAAIPETLRSSADVDAVLATHDLS